MDNLEVKSGSGDQFWSLFGGPVGRRMARWRMVFQGITELESQFSDLTDTQLKKESLSLRFRAKSGEKLDRLLPAAAALVRIAAQRTLQMRHYDVQLIGGMALFHGSIAEMDTGEGKTLTATLPLYMHALTGKGSHLATVNDYLARRDKELLEPTYKLLGMTAGVIQTDDTPDQRRQAYGCDITYGTAKEFGFDFLRDRLLLRRLGRDARDMLGEGSSQRWDDSGDQPVQRGAHFVLVDEADSILIDEARTPLIIGSLNEKAREQIVSTYEWAAQYAEQFVEDEDFDYDEEKKKVELTLEGRQRLRALPKRDLMRSIGMVDMYQYMERAVKVRRDYFLDRHYVARDGEIVIVDEFTGRLAEGRKWRDGIHQAIEAQTQVEVTVPTGQAARITVQDLFLRYTHLSGMTGTASSSTREFRKIYRLRVVPIPTNRPCQRSQLPDRVFRTTEDKLLAITEEVKQLHTEGRPILIGTRSIDKSEKLSRMLTEAGISHQVLNAHEVEAEAEIVSSAGEAGRVTVATNMAGRGTDIKLDDGVAELGGLQVICTELHDAARIDRQLIGRCGRQGDPGTFRQYLAIDDDIIENGFNKKRVGRIQKTVSQGSGGERQFGRLLRTAQRKVERQHFRDRNVLLYHEKERKKMQREMGQDPYLDTPD